MLKIKRYEKFSIKNTDYKVHLYCTLLYSNFISSNIFKINIMKQSDLKCRDRYNQTDRIPHKDLSKNERVKGTIIFIAVMVIGIPLLLWIADLLFLLN